MRKFWSRAATLVVLILLSSAACQEARAQEVLRLKGHDKQINSVAFSIDGKTIVSGGDDNLVIIWDAETGKEKRSYKHDGAVIQVAISPDAKRLAVAGAFPAVIVYDLADDKQPKRLLLRVNPRSRGSAVAFSANSRFLAAADVSGPTGAVQVWDLDGEMKPWSLPNAHSTGVNAVAFSPDGKWLATGSKDFKVKLWNAQNGKEVRVFDRATTGQVSSVAISPDNRWLAVGAGSNFRLFDLKDADKALPVHDIEAVKGVDRVSCVIFSPDGKSVVGASIGGTVKYWDTATGKEIYSDSLGRDTLSVAFNGDWSRLAIVIGREVSVRKMR